MVSQEGRRRRLGAQQLPRACAPEAKGCARPSASPTGQQTPSTSPPAAKRLSLPWHQRLPPTLLLPMRMQNLSPSSLEWLHRMALLLLGKGHQPCKSPTIPARQARGLRVRWQINRLRLRWLQSRSRRLQPSQAHRKYLGNHQSQLLRGQPRLPNPLGPVEVLSLLVVVVPQVNWIWLLLYVLFSFFLILVAHVILIACEEGATYKRRQLRIEKVCDLVLFTPSCKILVNLFHI